MKQLVRLKDIATYSKGLQINGDELVDRAEFDYLNGGINPSGKWNEANCVANTITISEGGNSCGYVNFMTKPFWCGAHCYYLHNTIDNSRYLYYALKSQQERIMKLRSGACMPNIKKRDLGNFEFIFDYDVKEQEKVTLVLSKLENVIEARKQELLALDNLIKARFVEMFGDVIHNDRKWEYKQFSDITTSRLGKMLDAKHQTGICKYPYLANFNVQWFRFELDNLNEMDFNEKDREEFCLEDGDLLVCEGGEIGRCAVWHNQVRKCFFQKALHRVRCNQNIILPDYLSWWFKYNCENGGFAAIEGAKATISHLTGAKMKMLDVTVPPIELQEQFVDFIKHVDKSKLLSLIKLLEQLITYLYNVFIIYRQDKGEEVEKYE